MIEGPPCHEPGITGFGDPSWGVVGIGIAPGGEEWRDLQTSGMRRPFTGPAGRLLDAFAEACNWPREKWYLTNHYCQYNDEPSQEQLDGCKDRVKQELHSLQTIPGSSLKLIIPFGDISCTQFYGKKSLTKHRGVPLWNEEYQCYVMPTYHPSAVLQGHTHLAADIIRDLQKIPDILTWEPNDKHGHYTYNVIRSRSEAQAFLNSLPHSPHIVTLDIEANPIKQESSDIWTDPLLCLAISTDGKHATVFPENWCRELDWPDDITWGYSYGTYDTQGIKKYLGVDLPIVHDIVNQSYSLDERTPRDRQDSKTYAGPKKGIHGLKPQANEFHNGAFYEDDAKRAWDKKSDKFDWDRLYKYNAGDAVYTWRSINYWLPRQRADNVERLYTDYLMPAYRAFSEQSYRGFCINVNNAHKLLSEWDVKSREQEEYLQEYASELGLKYRLNPGSPKQLAELLYDVIGLPLVDGKRSTARPIIEDMDHPFIDSLLEWRQLRHMIDTYLLGVVDDLKADGRVHPNVLLHGTVNGRVAYSDPPMQTLPKPYSVGGLSIVRSIFCSSGPEYVLLEADYNQIEMWLNWFQCKDPTMGQDLALGDYHRRTASRILKKPVEEITDHEKTYQGKKVNFGIAYGVGDETLANKYTGIGCTVQEAHDYRVAWHKAYPRYQPWVNKVIAECDKAGEIVVSPTGRKRRFPLPFEMMGYKVFKQVPNAMIQAPAGDYTLTSMIELHERLKEYKSFILLDVHDSLVFDLHRDHLTKTIPIITEVMEQPRFEGWPSVKVDCTIGTDLYNMQEIRKGGKWV